MKLEIEIGGTKRELVIEEESGRFRLEIDGRTIEGDVLRPEPGIFTFYVGDRVIETQVAELAGTEAYRVFCAGESRDLKVIDRKRRQAGQDGGPEGRLTLTAPMPGKVVDVLVAVGDTVEAGQGVVVVEAMKMQNEVKSSKAGAVTEVRVAPGQAVTAGQVLAIVD